MGASRRGNIEHNLPGNSLTTNGDQPTNQPSGRVLSLSLLAWTLEMASASVLPSADHLLLCSICRDVFSDPVTTPCGHSYCRACVTRHWDTAEVCRCPLCQQTFRPRPKVSVSIVLSEMVRLFRAVLSSTKTKTKSIRRLPFFTD